MCITIASHIPFTPSLFHPFSLFTISLPHFYPSSLSSPHLPLLSPPSLSLTDILLELSELDGYLQNTISLLCEKWWSKDVEGKNELMPNTLSYLVARTLSTGAKVH